MGTQWSQIPNTRPDNTLLPPEIVERIVEKLSVRDRLESRVVCKDWNEFLLQSPLLDEVKVKVEDTDLVLKTIVDYPFSGTWANYSFHALDLSRSSAPFWNLYGPHITSIDFYDVFLTASHNSDSGTEQEFRGICPNLKHLGLINCDRFFMMGGNYVQYLPYLFSLRNLESLNLSTNKYLKDSILFALLGENDGLKSLNLSECPMSFMNAVFKRFYPTAAENYPPGEKEVEYIVPPKMSDDILSFQAFYHWFLSSPKAANLTELILNDTRVNPEALSLLADPEQFHWESISLDRCLEVKAVHLSDFMTSQKNIKKLETGIYNDLTSDMLKSMQLTHIEHLRIHQQRALMDVNALQKSPNLKYLDFACIYFQSHSIALQYPRKLRVLKLHGTLNQPSTFENFGVSLTQLIPRLVNLRELVLDNIFFPSPAIVTNQLMQLIFQHLTQLQVLRISNPVVTDLGIAGTYVDEYDPRLPPGAVGRLREFYQENLVNNPIPGFSLTRLQNLKVLSLAKCKELREATWRKALNLPYLASLDLSECTQISKPGMMSIIASCRNLESIDIRGCGTHVTNDFEVLEAIKALPRIRMSSVLL